MNTHNIFLFTEAPLMSTLYICFLQEKCQFSGKLILVGQLNFDHLIIKFDNSTTLFYV